MRIGLVPTVLLRVCIFVKTDDYYVYIIVADRFLFCVDAGLRDLLAKIAGSVYYKIPPQMNRTAVVDSRLRDLDTLVELKV